MRTILLDRGIDQTETKDEKEVKEDKESLCLNSDFNEVMASWLASKGWDDEFDFRKVGLITAEIRSGDR